MIGPEVVADVTATCLFSFFGLVFLSLNLWINPSASHHQPPCLNLTVFFFNIPLYTFPVLPFPPPLAVHLCVWRHEAMKP